MKSNYLFLLLTFATTLVAQQKCEQLQGYDLCKLSDLKHILTVKPIIFTDALSRGLDSSAINSWTKVVDAIGAYIAKNHSELNKYFNQLRKISDSLVNTVKIARNAQSSADKQKVVDAFFANKELFKKSPEDTLATLRKDIAPGTFSGHKETRELLMDLAQALRTSIELVKNDTSIMQKQAVSKDITQLRALFGKIAESIKAKNGTLAKKLVNEAMQSLNLVKTTNTDDLQKAKSALTSAIEDIELQNWGPAERFVTYAFLKLNDIK